MKVFVFFAMLLVAFSIYSLPSRNDNVDTKASIHSTNFLIYRSCVMQYVFENNIINGVIDDTSLKFPTGFINKNWKAQIQGNILYIYGKTTQQEINEVKKQTMYSHSVGQKRNGLFYPHYTKSPIVLPSFIQEDNLVSVLEIVK